MDGLDGWRRMEKMGKEGRGGEERRVEERRGEWGREEERRDEESRVESSRVESKLESQGTSRQEKRPTHLPIRHLPKTLKHLLRRILILRHTNHKANKLLEAHPLPPTTRLAEALMHLLLIVHQPETGQRGRKLQLVQRVADVAVEVAEDGFELLELDRRQVRHVARHHLVFEKGEFLADGGFDEAELVGQLVVGVGCEVVFFNVGFGAAEVEGGDGGEEGVQGGEVGVEALHVAELVVDVAFEAGDGDCEGV